MSDIFQLEFLSVRDHSFTEALQRASIEDLERCLKLRTILMNIEKCCRIYSRLQGKRACAEKEKLSVQSYGQRRKA